MVSSLPLPAAETPVPAAEATPLGQAHQQIQALNKALTAADEQLRAANQTLRTNNAELEQKVAARTHALLVTLGQLERRGRDLAQALVAEQELGELKSRFVSMASHEFRTPLTVVLTAAILLEKYPRTDQQALRQEHLADIRAAVGHLTNLLEEFLSVGHIEEGTLRAHPANVDLAHLLDEAETEVQSLRKTGQVIVREVSCPYLLRLDGSLLRKIVVNLLSNALKYSGPGAVVTVRAACHDHQLALSVQDLGVGISQDDQAHLFERFFRARSAATVPGTGLGLYIIAKYSELMGGTVALRSRLHHGTTVTLTVPYEDENHSAD